MFAHPDEPTKYNRLALEKIGQEKERRNSKYVHAGDEPLCLGCLAVCGNDVERDYKCDDGSEYEKTRFLRTVSHG